MNLIVDNVAIPVEALEKFITPFWRDVWNYYPSYVRRLQSTARSRIAYMAFVCDALVAAGAHESTDRDEVRSADDWFRRAIEHFGADAVVGFLTGAPGRPTAESTHDGVLAYAKAHRNQTRRRDGDRN